MLRFFVVFYRVGGLFLTLYLLGFLSYVQLYPRAYAQPDTTTINTMDAYVVLTGDANRVEAGLDMLQQNPRPLLISGVHPDVQMRELTQARALSQALEDLIVLDYTAQSTKQNVAATRAWAELKQVQHIGLLTSNYHIPRAQLLFWLFAPHLQITPIALPTERSWWFVWREYNKLLVAPFLS